MGKYGIRNRKVRGVRRGHVFLLPLARAFQQQRMVLLQCRFLQDLAHRQALALAEVKACRRSGANACLWATPQIAAEPYGTRLRCFKKLINSDTLRKVTDNNLSVTLTTFITFPDQGKTPLSFFALTTRSRATMYAAIRIDTFFSQCTSQTSSNARFITFSRLLLI